MQALPWDFQSQIAYSQGFRSMVAGVLLSKCSTAQLNSAATTVRLDSDKYSRMPMFLWNLGGSAPRWSAPVQSAAGDQARSAESLQSHRRGTCVGETFWELPHSNHGPFTTWPNSSMRWTDKTSNCANTHRKRVLDASIHSDLSRAICCDSMSFGGIGSLWAEANVAGQCNWIHS